MGIHLYRGKTPRIHPSVFVAEGVHVIGDVEIGKDSSLWYNAVIRGDVNYILIGERTNIQDGAVLHVTYEKFPLIVGSNVTVGHSAVLHAATINDYCLIGMNATVLDDAHIGSYCLIAAGAVVLGGTVIPDGMLAAGVPAKVIRPLTAEERKALERSAQNYIDYVAEYRK
ncbi:MAG: gamma carbonic anhydrase family protein [Ignavibacteriales bacterium]|nr:gamma carbonic anhydrase family protein [Ignavibacteriales bacterium]